MKLPRPLLSSVWSLCALAVVNAQTAAPAPRPPAEDEVVFLETFTVNTDKDTGYIAADSLLGGRINTNVLKTPTDLTVLTSEFLNDIGSVNYQDAAQWLTNTVVTPANANNSNSDFGGNASVRGIPGGYQARNYFRYLNPIDAYITERVEGARGPNALLFTDGVVGGVVNTLTKRARFGRPITTLQLRTDSEGTRRGTLDVNRELSKTLAVRLNLLAQEGRSWISTAFDDHLAADLAATWRLNPKGELRVEAEVAERDTNYATTFYTDSASRWDGVTTTTTVGGALASLPAATTGVVRIAGANQSRLIYGPAFVGSGVQDFRNFTQTQGTGLSLIPETRSFPGYTNTPVVSRDFAMQSPDSRTTVDYSVLNAFFEQGLGENFAFELAYARLQQERAFQALRPSAYTIDTNTLLPNGATNPNLGRPYVEAANFIQDLNNTITEYRGAAVYTLPFKSFSQRLNVLVGHRTEVFRNRTGLVGRTNNPTVPLATDNQNRIFYRYYLKDGPGPILTPPNAGGYTFEFVPTTVLRQPQTLKYAQVATVGSYWEDRITVIAGVRRDDYRQTQNNVLTRDPVGRPLTFGDTSVTEALVTTRSLGTVVFPIPSVGVFANYSETFNPVPSGNPRLSGGDFRPTDGTGHSFGLRFNLLEGRLVGSVSRYRVEEAGRVVTGPIQGNVAAIRNIIGGTAFNAYRDSLDYEGEGYELDFVANLTKNLRVRFNAALPETSQSNTIPDTRAFVAAELPTWQAAQTNPAYTDAQRTTIQTNIDNIALALTNAAEGRPINGTAKYTANVFGNYTFARGPLARLRVGAGANFVGRQIIGNQPNQPFAYLRSAERYLVTATLGYSLKVRTVPVDLQLNVTNLLDDDEPVYTGTASFNPGSGNVTFRNGFYFPDPRKATLTATIRF